LKLDYEPAVIETKNRLDKKALTQIGQVAQSAYAGIRETSSAIYEIPQIRTIMQTILSELIKLALGPAQAVPIMTETLCIDEKDLTLLTLSPEVKIMTNNNNMKNNDDKTDPKCLLVLQSELALTYKRTRHDLKFLFQQLYLIAAKYKQRIIYGCLSDLDGNIMVKLEILSHTRMESKTTVEYIVTVFEKVLVSQFYLSGKMPLEPESLFNKAFGEGITKLFNVLKQAQLEICEFML